jgi:hypothetical protein
VVVGRDQLVTRILRGGEQRFGTLRPVGAALDAAAHQKRLRVVRQLARVEYDFHDSPFARSRLAQ